MYSVYVILPFSNRQVEAVRASKRRPSPWDWREAYLDAQTEKRKQFIDSRPWSGNLLSDERLMINFNCWILEDELDELLDLFHGCQGSIKKMPIDMLR